MFLPNLKRELMPPRPIAPEEPEEKQPPLKPTFGLEGGGGEAGGALTGYMDSAVPASNDPKDSFIGRRMSEMTPGKAMFGLGAAAMTGGAALAPLGLSSLIGGVVKDYVAPFVKKNVVDPLTNQSRPLPGPGGFESGIGKYGGDITAGYGETGFSGGYKGDIEAGIDKGDFGLGVDPGDFGLRGDPGDYGGGGDVGGRGGFGGGYTGGDEGADSGYW